MKDVMSIPENAENVTTSIEDGEVIVEYDEPDPVLQFSSVTGNSVTVGQDDDFVIEKLPDYEDNDYVVHFTDGRNNSDVHILPPSSKDKHDHRWKFADVAVVME